MSQLSLCKTLVARGRSRGGPRSPTHPLYFGQKEQKLKKRRKADRAGNTAPSSLLTQGLDPRLIALPGTIYTEKNNNNRTVQTRRDSCFSWLSFGCSILGCLSRKPNLSILCVCFTSGQKYFVVSFVIFNDPRKARFGKAQEQTGKNTNYPLF